MKSKASLFLMEQLIMLLVFALAAALCLGVFVHADQVSRQVAAQDEAVLIAQNTAEILKETGDAQLAKTQAGSGAFAVEILEEDSGVPGLRQAKIVVFHENEEVFALHTGWQEVAP